MAKILSYISNIQAEELVNFIEVQSNIFKAMVSGYGNKVPEILHSVKEASTMLESEGAKYLLAAFQNIIATNHTASTLEGQTKHLPYLPDKIGKKPQTCLNNIKVGKMSICQRV